MDDDKVFDNLDELLEQMRLDEQADAPLITPVDYGKIHSGTISAQNVYYHIRAGHLRTYTCPCGRKCIKREEADDLFRKKGRLKLCLQNPPTGSTSMSPNLVLNISRPVTSTWSGTHPRAGLQAIPVVSLVATVYAPFPTRRQLRPRKPSARVHVAGHDSTKGQ